MGRLWGVRFLEPATGWTWRWTCRRLPRFSLTVFKETQYQDDDSRKNDGEQNTPVCGHDHSRGLSELRRPISPMMRSSAGDSLSAPTSRAASLNRSDCFLSLIDSPLKLQGSRGCYIKHRPRAALVLGREGRFPNPPNQWGLEFPREFPERAGIAGCAISPGKSVHTDRPGLPS